MSREMMYAIYSLRKENAMDRKEKEKKRAAIDEGLAEEERGKGFKAEKKG